MVNSTPKPRDLNTRFSLVFIARLQLASENVFCQGMIVLLNPVCVLFTECFSEVRVAGFET